MKKIKITEETKNKMGAFYFVAKLFSSIKSPFGYFCLGIYNGFTTLAHTLEKDKSFFMSDDYPGEESMSCAAKALISSFKYQEKIEESKEILAIAEILKKECEEEVEDEEKVVH